MHDITPAVTETLLRTMRRRNDYYTEVANRHGVSYLGVLGLARWRRAHDWLVANDPEYVWGE